MDRTRDGVNDGDGDAAPRCAGKRHEPRTARAARVLLLALGATLALAATADAQARRAATPKPSPTPDPMIGQMENVIAELRQINATLGTVKTALDELGGRLDRVEQVAAEIKGIATPMRDEVRGLYVETSNVRSEIARLEEKSVAEAESLGKSRYVLTLLLVATAVLQLVVLAVLLRSR